jgi:hypothetical protein
MIVERGLAPFCRPKKSVFTVLLVRRFFVSRIRVARFFGEKQDGKQFSFANRRSIYRLAAPSLCRGD